MRFNLRWQILLAALAFSLTAALLSFQVRSASLCATRVPAAGGVFVEGAVGLPQTLNPLLSDPYPLDRQLVSLIFDGLTQVDASGQIAPALAENWSVSEDGRTLRFVLRDDVAWHDGEPVTAADVAFTYGLMQGENFPGPAALKNLWQSVTINQIDDQTIEFVLTEPYAPFLSETTRGILPAHLLEGVTAASLAEHPFNQSPVGTGPWMVNANQDWRQNGRLQLLPNPLYWREGTQIPILEFQFFPDEAALAEAFADGRIHAMNTVSPEMLPDVAAIPGVRLFTAESPRYTELLFNQGEDGAPLLKTTEGRQALAYALDRNAVVDRVLNGQGLPLEGPYLPTSWAYNPAALTRYQYDPTAAQLALSAAGWEKVEGVPVRRNEAGDPLQIRLLTLAGAPHEPLAEEIAWQWADIGIDAVVETAVNGAALREALAEGDFDVALVDIAPPVDPDLYDFWSQEAIVRGQNYGRWNNRNASEALENGRQIWPVAERRPYYDTFLRLFNSDLPALTLYQHAATYALSPTVEQAEIGKITQPRDQYKTFAQWFLLYRDGSIVGPAEEVTPVSE
ncbi:MAG TPA: peptide ABC transporter substrate-binding protein [Anaerolineae bacterium]|nr:peptide ABC transporter substrate-binding protein [Anaerolineae bacterium]